MGGCRLSGYWFLMVSLLFYQVFSGVSNCNDALRVTAMHCVEDRSLFFHKVFIDNAVERTVWQIESRCVVSTYDATDFIPRKLFEIASAFPQKYVDCTDWSSFTDMFWKIQYRKSANVGWHFQKRYRACIRRLINHSSVPQFE